MSHGDGAIATSCRNRPVPMGQKEEVVKMGSEQRGVTIAIVTRVRAEGNSSAEVVAELPKGTELDVHVKVDPFVQISAWHPELGQVSGWVHKNFVSSFGESASVPERSLFADPSCVACGALNWVHTNSDRFLHLALLHMVAIKYRICLSCGLVQECIGAKEAEELRIWRNSRA